MIKVNGLSVSRIPINGKETLRVMKNGQRLWSGTGLPAGYTLLEYIESTGAQYIDTGFKHNQNTRVVMRVLPTVSGSNAFLFDGPSSDSNRKGVFYQNSKSSWAVDYGASSNRQYFSGLSSGEKFQIDFNKNICSINGETKTFTASTFQSTVNLLLFASNYQGTAQSFVSAKLYSCQIYDNDTLIRDYIPCMDANGTYGLYDKVNKQFYGSASSTPFTGA